MTSTAKTGHRTVTVDVAIEEIVADVREIILHRFRTVTIADLLALSSPPVERQATLRAAPRIGEYWHGQGGVYAGIARGLDGDDDQYLIVGPSYDGTVTWTDGRSWAVGLEVDGHRDFSLPLRKEQALAFANVPELFEAAAYWSAEQHESYSTYAWSQDFSYGYQLYWHKDNKLRARAVRRLAIQ